MKKIKIGIIGTNGLPGRYGGWDHLLNELTKELGERHDITVYTSYKNGYHDLKTFNNAYLYRINLDANGWQSIPYDIYSMYLSVKNKHDVLLVLGTSGCLVMPLLKLIGATVILNPDGAEWERGKWGRFAKMMLYTFDRIGVRYAKYVVADNKVIYERILKLRSDVNLIEYGGDNAKKADINKCMLDDLNLVLDKYAFKVCRIVPENNVEMILNVFSRNKRQLVLVGNWGVSDYSRNLKEKYSSFKNINLIGPIYEQDKIDSLRSNCHLYIHGHSVGGTNPSLVEAMNLGLPCIVFNVDYNLETTENSALYFNDEESLSDLIDRYWSDSDFLEGLGRKMMSIAKKRYTWKRIIAAYDALFLKALKDAKA